MNRERARRWNLEERQGNGSFPYVIRSGEDVVCQVRSKSEGDIICWSRGEAIREASTRAADARRFRMVRKRLEVDICTLVQMLSEVGDVLRLMRPREVVRMREQIHKVLLAMKSRGYHR